MRVQSSARRLKTTVGDLVVAAMEAALEVSRDERKAPRLAGIVLNKILKDSRLRAERLRRGPSKNNLAH
jgi:hypothetical protein